MIVDLERHRVAALLPARDADHVAAWLARYPGLSVVSRDRSALFAEAATRGAPQATQVADRFHVLRNLGEARETFLLYQRAKRGRRSSCTNGRTSRLSHDMVDRSVHSSLALKRQATSLYQTIDILR